MYLSISHFLHELHTIAIYKAMIGEEKCAEYEDFKYLLIVHHISGHRSVPLVKRFAPASPADRDGRCVPALHLWRPQQARYLCDINETIYGNGYFKWKIGQKKG